MDDLLLRLRTHDWYYEYSDHFEVWQKGHSDWRDIQALAARLGPDAAEMVRLWSDPAYRAQQREQVAT